MENEDIPEDFLEYPLWYFDQTTGSGPKTIAEAALYWSWWKNRPRGNAKETEEPCGKYMLNEINNNKKNLRAFVRAEYHDYIRVLAAEHGLINTATNDTAILTNDIKIIMSMLPNSPVNNRLVYDIFYSFHKHRDWLANTIDKWLIKNKMWVKPPEKIDDKKLYVDMRGGFTRVGCFAKSNVVTLYKNNLYNRMGWCLALTLPSTQPTRNPPKVYTRVNIEDDQHYYVVTPPISVQNNLIINNRILVDIDLYHDIDYDNIARTLNLNVEAVRTAI